MFNRASNIAAAAILGLIVNGVAHGQGGWDFMETFSNADRSIQFIVLEFNSYSTRLPGLAGQTLIASDGTTEHSFTFPSDVAHHFSDSGIDTASCGGDDGCWAYALVATQGFADLHLVQPDFVVPNGFLFLPNGSVRLSASASTYGILPIDGEHANWWDGDAGPLRALAINNVGESYLFLPAGIHEVVEYYHSGLDDYFLTAYPWEIEFPATGWQRTGYTLLAWTSPVSSGVATPSNLAPVCRLWLLDSHFYSISKSECADVLARNSADHSASPYVRESDAAFFATLPDAETGTCPAGQTRVFRLWNPHGSGHRYTTETVVRDEMLARGYIAEGYGPDSVAMCVGGSG